MAKTALNPKNLESVATRFRILGVPLRLEILNQLADGERTVTALVEATRPLMSLFWRFSATDVSFSTVPLSRSIISSFCPGADPSNGTGVGGSVLVGIGKVLSDQ